MCELIFHPNLKITVAFGSERQIAGYDIWSLVYFNILREITANGKQKILVISESVWIIPSGQIMVKTQISFKKICNL